MFGDNFFPSENKIIKSKCLNCHKESILISDKLSLCVDCIRTYFNKVHLHIKEVHGLTRREFGLPDEVPENSKGINCNLCLNNCSIPENGMGYCGIRKNVAGKLIGGDRAEGKVDWYLDPIPTNCVAHWVCPASTDAGYPRWTVTRGIEYECNNLAVFYRACNFNCLYCQNWEFRKSLNRPVVMSSWELSERVDDTTTCICFFGGDPTPQLDHAITASKLAIEKNKNKVLRICWETNGSMNQAELREMIELSLNSGGCIKFDLKAWNKEVNIALSGVSNERTLSNFELAVNETRSRQIPPPIVASTLLVPGYIDEQEITGISRFIASLDPDIPYTLLGFHPDFHLDDLPATSKKHAFEAQKIAKEAGLRNVKIANMHLLGDDY